MCMLLFGVALYSVYELVSLPSQTVLERNTKNNASRAILCDVHFSHEYKSVLDLSEVRSVNRHVICMGLA